jgi:CheY-like chemotaxis protein
MVQNVLSNCLKYGRQRPVLVGVRRRHGGLVVEIHDQGQGIAEEHLSRVFEEFYRVRQLRDKDVEGVGLGLSIVKRLGLLMGMDVMLRSRVGRGTSVSLSGLPLATAPEQHVVRDDPRQAGLLTGLKVCLVEDDHNVLLATQALLERWGCKVQAESSGHDLVSDCDIIVADYDLGNHATGIECIDHLRAQRGVAVPALILTGHDLERIQAALHDRQIAILSKPVRPAELRGALRELSQGPLTG